jgi:type I restriction enzyme M protein
MRGKPEGESRCSWTVDFAERRARARVERQPFLDEVARIKAAVVDLKEQLKRWKKDKAAQSKRDVLETDIREKEKAARELENKAAGIDAAVFDLKAVNPNAVTKVDTRTPQEIIGNIEAQGRIVVQALAKLTLLLVEPN